MKLSKRIVPAVAAAMLGCLPGCSPSSAGQFQDNGGGFTIINNTFSIQASQQPWTMEGTGEQIRESFAENDRMSVFAYVGDEKDRDVVVDNEINVFDGSLWQSENAMEWKSAVDKHYFQAVIPALEQEEFDLAALDYDVTRGDIMIASASSKYTSEPVNLEFTHLLGRLEVILLVGNSLGDDVQIKEVSLKGIRTAKVNCLNGEIIPGITSSDIPMSLIGEQTNGVCRFSGTFLPADYLPGSLKVKVASGDRDIEITYGGLIKMEKGKICRLKLVAGEHYLNDAEAGAEGWIEGDNGDGQISQQF